MQRHEALGLEKAIRLDEIGEWSQIKHDILKRYATEYSRILTNQPGLSHYYIDAFSGPGLCVSKKDRRILPGSPLNALATEPPFEHYFFIDIDQNRTEALKQLVGERDDVTILAGDCNSRLLDDVFPRVRRGDYRRALCLLDPYGIHLDWKIVETAGTMESIEIFLNFSISDINRNLAHDDPSDLSESNIQRMDRFWGAHDWYDMLFAPETDLFGSERQKKYAKANIKLVEAYRNKLRREAGFKFVPKPVPFSTGKGGILYFLYFASHNKTGEKIVKHIFDKYRLQGGFESRINPA